MIRTRVSAAAAVLALVAASVLLGAGAAQAGVINPPVITTTDGNTVDNTPLILGTVDDLNGLDLTIQVYVTNGGGTSNYCQVSLPTSGAPANDVLWGCSGTAVPFGANTFTADVWEDFEPGVITGPSNAVVLTVGGTQPAAVGAPAPGAVMSDATPAFSGTGPSLGLIDVNNGAGTSYCVTNVDVAGNWACTAANALPAAVYNVQADPTWINGAPDAGTTPQTLEVVAPPDPTVTQSFSPWVTSATWQSVQGNKDVDANYVQVYVSTDGVNWGFYCNSTGANAGVGSPIWFCDDGPMAGLTLGTNFISAIAFNEGNAASGRGPSITIDRVLPPTITTPAEGLYTSDTTPTISGASPGGTGFTVWEDGGEFVYCSGAIAAGQFSCNSSPLPDGVHSVFVEATPGQGIFSTTRTFTVDTIAPGAPLITAPGGSTTSTHPTVSGTAEPFATVALFRDGGSAACLGGTVTANSAGTWSCATTAILSVGRTYGFSAVQTDRAGNASSAGVPAPQRYVEILAPTVIPPTPPPAEPWTFDFGLDGDEFEPGDSTRVTGAGLPAGANVDIEFHSDPVLLATTVVEPDGTFDALVTIPEDADEGEHHFVVVVTPTDAPPSTQQQPVMVHLPAAAVDPGDAEETTGGGGGPGVDRADPAAPSSLTASLDTFGDILRNPIVLGTAALAGLALLLFVAFPAELLNSTISEQYSRFSRRMPKAPWLGRFTDWLETTPLFGAIAVTVVAAVIFGFADPGFGFEVTSLRVVLACAIALFIVGYLASWIAGRLLDSRWQLGSVMELKPLGLVLAVIGVVLSRILEFSPGFLIGLLIGIGLVGRTTAAQQAKSTLVQAAVVFALALFGWIGYSILSATTAPDSFAVTLAFDTLAAVTTEGLTALFIGLLPFRFLDGASLFAHSKAVWAASYAVVAAAFVLIVIPSAWGEPDGSLWLWVAVVGGFAVVAIAIYLYFRFVAKPIEDDDDEDADLPVLEDAR
jgi:hypothetical protein